jgi:hypothetical protein
MPKVEAPNRVSAEQLRYAKLLNRAAMIGIVVLVVGFGAYAFGLLQAHVPVERLPALWSQPLGAYLRETGTPTGWGWLAYVDKGEFASLAGIAVLSGCSLVCLLAVIPIYARRGERIYAAICILEIAVLLLAASGVLTVGH